MGFSDRLTKLSQGEPTTRPEAWTGGLRPDLLQNRGDEGVERTGLGALFVCLLWTDGRQRARKAPPRRDGAPQRAADSRSHPLGGGGARPRRRDRSRLRAQA